MASKKTFGDVKFLLLGFLLISFVGNIYFYSQNQKATQVQNNLSQQIKEQNEDAQLYIERRGKLVSRTQEPYEFTRAGVYSPLFKGPAVDVTRYDYLKIPITHQSIDLKIYKDHQVWVNIWSGKSNDGFPIFDGYENNALMPRFGTEAMKPAEIKYVSKNGLRFRYTEHYQPKSVGAISLETPILFTEPRRYLVITVQANNYPGASAQDIAKALNIAKEVADTIDVQIY